jgi:hypothetical protein
MSGKRTTTLTTSNIERCYPPAVTIYMHALALSRGGDRCSYDRAAALSLHHELALA